MIGIVSIGSKLLKTVGLFAVRLNLAKLRLKNWIEKSNFWLKSQSRIFDQNGNPFFDLKIQFFGCYKENKRQIEECHTSLNSLLNLQSIGIKTKKFLTFHIF